MDPIKVEFKKYGPGKFSNNIEEMVYDAAEDTIEDGDTSYSLTLYPELVVVTQDGRNWSFGGAILRELSSGLVEVTYFDSYEKAQEEFDRIANEISEEENDE